MTKNILSIYRPCFSPKCLPNLFLIAVQKWILFFDRFDHVIKVLRGQLRLYRQRFFQLVWHSSKVPTLFGYLVSALCKSSKEFRSSAMTTISHLVQVPPHFLSVRWSNSEFANLQGQEIHKLLLVIPFEVRLKVQKPVRLSVLADFKHNFKFH